MSSNMEDDAVISDASVGEATKAPETDSGVEDSSSKQPTCAIILGMAGSGKTTLMQRLNAHLHQHKRPGYVINLDPAATKLPYAAHIDIRDTINYKQVMKQYNLGPNGGIVTSLNLFSTRFDQVLAFVEKRASSVDYIIVDTPGQIEVFSWSASGSIITQALANVVPTVLVYIVDTPRAVNPTTFVSNMLYACSILYKYRLPLVLVFNKVDVVPCEFARQWLQDDESLLAALEGETAYMATLARSLALVLEEFYNTLTCVGVSAVTGEGMDEFFAALDTATAEYHKHYKPALDKLKADKEQEETARQEEQMRRLNKDMAAASLDTPSKEKSASNAK